METMYFLYDKHIFRTYNHDFLEEENIFHQTYLISVCYTFGWGSTQNQALGRSSLSPDQLYAENPNKPLTFITSP